MVLLDKVEVVDSSEVVVYHFGVLVLETSSSFFPSVVTTATTVMTMSNVTPDRTAIAIFTSTEQPPIAILKSSRRMKQAKNDMICPACLRKKMHFYIDSSMEMEAV